MTRIIFCQPKNRILVRVVDFERRDFVGFQLDISAVEPIAETQRNRRIWLTHLLYRIIVCARRPVSAEHLVTVHSQFADQFKADTSIRAYKITIGSAHPTNAR